MEPVQPLADVLDRLYVVALPMRVRFRGITVREVALIDGPAGWGEFGAFPEYGTAEASAWLASAIEAAACALAVSTDRVPPTINFREPDPECDLDCVPRCWPGFRGCAPRR
jgi:O-succinylbenzoate synthase